MTRLLIACLFAALVLPWMACSEQKEVKPPPAPPPTYSGPEFLRTTIGSLSGLRGFQATLVSGYGLVVNLNGTGSADVPPGMREWLIEEMRRKGFGTVNSGLPGPERVLASNTAAVVLIEGIIPPAAPEGTRFDLLVRALPETQTTSLEGGTLYTTDLRIGGADFGAAQLSSVANGRGPVFLNPFLDPTRPGSTGGDDDPRVGRILAGGMVTTDMPIQIVTYQESYRTTTQIANRINTRFPQAPGDKAAVAVALDASVVQINIPRRYRDRPRELLEVISRIYLNPTAAFLQAKAMELGKVLEQPGGEQNADDVAWAWEGIGKTILPIVREYYTHDNPRVRFAALQAGARLEDTRTADALMVFARSATPGVSERATRLLGDLLKANPSNARVGRMLHELLDSEDAIVRMSAVEPLMAVGDPAIGVNQFPDKLELVRVRCEKPMIYVSRQGTPRIVVFNDRLQMVQPTMFSTVDNRFMVRTETDQPNASIFYQRPGNARPVRESIPANVPYLVGMMAFQPKEDSRSPGLDMPYSQVVSVLYQLTKQGNIPAPFVLQPSSLIDDIAAQRAATLPAQGRPESKDAPNSAPPRP